MSDELEMIRRKKMLKLMKEKLISEKKTEVPTEIVILNSETLESMIQSSDVPVLVDFHADWCMPCKVFAPTIDQLVSEYAGRVIFGKIDVDTNRDAAWKYGIRGVPTLILFHKGKPAKVIVGAVPKAKIETAIKSVLK